MPMPTNELIALAVAVAVALGVLSLMLWVRGAAAGLPPRLIARALSALWLASLAVLALLFGLRTVAGPLLTGSPAEGYAVEQLTPRAWAAVAAAALVMVAAFLWLRHVMRPFMRPVAPPDESC